MDVWDPITSGSSPDEDGSQNGGIRGCCVGGGERVACVHSAPSGRQVSNLLRFDKGASEVAS